MSPSPSQTTKCGEIVKAFLKKASMCIEGRYLPVDLLDDKGTIGADKRSGEKNNTLEKQPVLSVDGVEMANHTKIIISGLLDAW